MRPDDPSHALQEGLELDPTAFVAPGATVVGRATLRARSSVWFSAVIRADMDAVVLGEESNLQDGAVIDVDHGFPTTIGRRVTIGHRAIVHGATVEDDCLIGMGSIVLTGARVGAGSLIAAGALVREGQEIPAASLVVGAPARVIGPVKPEHTAAIANGVDHYLALSASYRAKGYAAAFPPGRAGLVQKPLVRDGEVVWFGLLALLERSPVRLAQELEACSRARLAARPAAGGWSALDVLAHLRDVEADVYMPRLAQFLDGPGDGATILAGAGDVDARNAAWAHERDYAATDPGAACAAFARARTENLQCLALLLPAARSRAAIHPTRGPITLFEQVERMAEHDLAHMRQIERALATS